MTIRSVIVAAVTIGFATHAHAQWIMVVNNSFAQPPAHPSVALVQRSDGALVDVHWIVPAAGEGNWNGNCSAQDAVQVGSEVWVGSSNANCGDRVAAIYIYSVDFSGAVPVATFSRELRLTAVDVGLASTQPRGLFYNAAANLVYMTDGNGIHALNATTGAYTGNSRPGNAWGITMIGDEVLYSVIASGGIRKTNATVTSDLGTLIPGSSSGFWPYELDINNDGNLVASGFSASGYNIREWTPAGVFVGDPYPGTINLRGMAVLDNGSYLLSRNIHPFDLFVWNGVAETVIVSGAGTGPVPEVTTPFLPYMMGYLDAPPPSCGSADFDGDGDTGTDQDIEAFFACLGGNCCPTCGTADFDGDGDTGTDADIEAFFRVLGGGTC